MNGSVTEIARGAVLREAFSAEPFFPLPCGGHGRCGKCKVTASGALSKPTAAEMQLLSEAELARGIRLACCARAEGDCTVSFALDSTTRIQLAGVLPAVYQKHRYTKYGIAMDIGTTTLAAVLYGPDGLLVAQASADNPQATWGADVISRIEAALKGEAHSLSAAIRQALSSLIKTLAIQAKIETSDVDTLVITGNTAMLYLLTDTDTACLSHAPFVATRLFGQGLPAETLNLPCPGATVYLPRCISAFVGADITTALLASEICSSDSTRMLVDIGTNGEMALWHLGQLHCCSTAAGPAFEGAGISMGMRGQDGAIDHISVKDGELISHVLGDVRPTGICGSGIVDALACLLETDQLDETGLLAKTPFPIAGKVSLTQKDIRMVQLAKSAICAGLLTLLHSRNLSLAALTELNIAGGFGSYLDVQCAARIGLLPAELTSRVRVVGNAALSGAVMLLLNQDLAEVSTTIAYQAQTVDLSTNPCFLDFYTKCMLF